ncbi:hypothetical protein QBC46DRAFT_397159 [Diplogelasinospora grovesii]|uniref:Uncharacterized protein n=1 Tax=Diplogelasinospora grovesii TaxID=303347 RepID=A0AAN6S055_9PEZI|nr:hypothetical protein QBC46DRAFT_397159 [Diplogelasinospora grovesii]
MAFPTAPLDLCERTLLRFNKDEKKAYRRLRKSYDAGTTLGEMLAQCQSLRFRGETGDDLDANDDDAESVNSLVRHYDQHGFPSGSILAGTASTRIVEALRKSGQPMKRPVHTRFDGDPTAGVGKAFSVTEEASQSEFDADSDSDGEYARYGGEEQAEETHVDSESDPESIAGSADDESSSDSDDDSGPEVASSKEIPNVRPSANIFAGDGGSSSASGSDSDSESTEDSSDDSDSGDERPSSSESESGASSDSDQNFSGASSDDESDSDSGSRHNRSISPRSASASAPAPTKPSSARLERSALGSTDRPDSTETASTRKQSAIEAPPGQGKKATKKRNARKRLALKAKQAAARGQLLGLVSPSASGVFTHQGQSSTDMDSVSAKKAALLKRLETLDTLAQAVETGTGSEKSMTVPTPQLPPAASATVHDTSGPTESHSRDLTEASSRRRTKADVGAARRVLFGALGLRNPKTKADEDKIRSDLMRGIRPHSNPRVEGVSDRLHDNEPQEHQPVEDDPEAWRDNITYRAVECCQDGIELSEPPFPFVQRWDAQQQWSWKDKSGQRGGRSKRKQRNQVDYYEEGESHPSAKRRKYAGDEEEVDNTIGDFDKATDDFASAHVTLNYDDEPDRIEERSRPEPVPGTVDGPSDLPPVPDDLSTLPPLQEGEARPGMILTWKHWLLSKATNWQPQVSCATGLVVDASDNNSLRVLLAKRDWNLGRYEKTYDDDGNRVYDKFEAPGMGDDDDAEEDGYRTVQFSELIEPRILQQPARSASHPVPARQPNDKLPDLDASESRGSGSASGDQSTTLDHEEPERNARQENAQQGTHMEVYDHDKPDDDASMSDERRHEISLLISDAGFRKDINPSLDHDKPFDLSSPSRQLEEMSQAETGFPDSPPKGLSAALPGAPRASDLPNSRDASSQANSNPSIHVDSQPISLAPFNGASDELEGPVAQARVAYPKLDVPPSDASSVRSGRQPDPDYSVDLGNDSFSRLEENADEVGEIIESTPRPSKQQLKTPTRERGHQHGSPAMSVSSVSSIPSLSEFWGTASTSGKGPTSSAESVVTPAMKARGLGTARDLDYEAAMQRLDDDEEEVSSIEDGYHVNKAENGSKRYADLARELVEKPIEKPSGRKSLAVNKIAAVRLSSGAVKVEKGSRAPPSADSHLPRAREFDLPRPSSQFSIPEGSQVVSLLTSSPEPVFEENYAEDSIDGTYEDSTSLPSGSGWVKKARNPRAGSMPAAAARQDKVPRRLGSTQPVPGTVRVSSIASNSMPRLKKKTTAGLFG